MAALENPAARGDVILVRGVTNEWGVLWEQGTDASTYRPVNLAAWRAELTLASPFGEVWLTRQGTTAANGVTTLRLNPADLRPAEWDTRTSGTWSVNITSPGGRVERLAAGYFALEA